MKKIFIVFTIICSVFCGFLPLKADDSGVGLESTGPSSDSLPPLTDAEKEARVGNLFDLYTTETFVILEDETLTKKVSQIVEKIAKVSDHPEIEYKVKIINDPLPVASSFPNGFIYVSTGLLDILENEDELAAVLSNVIVRMHEKYQYNAFTTEWKRRKTIKTVSTVISIALAVGGGVAIGADIGDNLAKALIAAGTVAAVAGVQVAGEKMIKHLPSKKVSLNKMGPHLNSYDLATSSSVFIFFKEVYEGYDSEKELKATELSIQNLNKAGCNPKALVSVLERFAKLRDEYLANGYICNLLIAQPGFERRIAYAQELIAKK